MGCSRASALEITLGVTIAAEKAFAAATVGRTATRNLAAKLPKMPLHMTVREAFSVMHLAGQQDSRRVV